MDDRIGGETGGILARMAQTKRNNFIAKIFYFIRKVKTMNIKNHILLVVLCVITMLSGCMQWTITGQNSLLKPNTKDSTKLVGIYTKSSKDQSINEDQSIKSPSDVVSISLKTLYLKYIQSIWDFDVIVYAEVYDIVDERKVLKRVAFHRLNQPSNSYLNVAGNLLYGPIHFEGYPITIKFYVFELDKKNNELLSEVLKVVSSVASAAQPQYGTAIEMVSSIMHFVINSNQDDLELSQEITLCPLSDIEKNHYSEAFLVAPLEAGDLVIVKREDKDRIVTNRWWWFDTKSDKKAKEEFGTSTASYDATTGRLTVGGKDFEDKTYAVLTVSKSAKAVERAMLDQISTNVQETLGDILIHPSQSEQDKIDAIKKMGATAEATVRIFKIKNSISGKKDKEAALAKEYKRYQDADTDADKRVKQEIERLWEEETGKTVEELKKAAENLNKQSNGNHNDTSAGTDTKKPE